RSNHIKDGQARSADIGNGTITNANVFAGAAVSASKINRTGLDADLLDGNHASAFAGVGHDHDSQCWPIDKTPGQIALLAPINAGEELAGFIGIDMIGHKTFIPDQARILLKISADIIGDAFDRYKHDQYDQHFH
ncbi:MAG: hypothetical protein KAX16_07245, partial [Actinomycetia bacterium]|nr:hypothetical protein [Actinomycetes bacterium]